MNDLLPILLLTALLGLIYIFLKMKSKKRRSNSKERRYFSGRG